MVHGIEPNTKNRQKKKGFWQKFSDMFDNKRAVESYCHRFGTQTKEDEKTKDKKKKKELEQDNHLKGFENI